MIFLFALFLLLLFKQSQTAEQTSDYFAKFEEMMMAERSRQAVEVLHNDFAADRLKEIEISCPGEIPPLVKIRDLLVETSFSNNERRECTVLKLTGKNFNFRLSLYCDEKDNAKFDFSSE